MKTEKMRLNPSPLLNERRETEMRIDEMLKVQSIVDNMEDEITRLKRPISTLELTTIKRSLPLYDERMIYEVAVKLIALRNGTKI